MKTFRELYCTKHEIAPELFERHLLQRCLFPSARVFARLFPILSSQHFELERDFLRAVGDLTRIDCYTDEVHEFRHHRANHRWLRRVLRLRLSTTVLRQEVFSILGRRIYVVSSPRLAPGIQPPPHVGQPAAA